MTESYRSWLWEKLAERTIENLKNNDFDAHVEPDCESAGKRILDMASRFESFGFGGSATTRALGVIEALEKQSKTIYDHWKPGITPEEDMETRLMMGRCDCFLTSANAITETGEIINVDGVGNRTNAMTFGPKKVFVVAGMNKVVPDLDAGLKRIKEVAGPMRAKSLEMKTPCTETGKCRNCKSPQRICRVTVILHRRPLKTDISVILIKDALGF